MTGNAKSLKYPSLSGIKRERVGDYLLFGLAASFYKKFRVCSSAIPPPSLPHYRRNKKKYYYF
jgi:hypothetical protein